MKIVLLPGFPDFTNLGVEVFPRDYFRQVQPALHAKGFEVYAPKVGPFGNPEERSGPLVDELTAMGVFDDDRRAHLIAHSAGGLDARYLVSPDAPNGPRLARRFRSITTISTPHRGTPIADLANGLVTGGEALLPILRREFPNLDDGVRGLTTQEMKDFNRRVSDSPDVEYFSYAGLLTAERILEGSVFGLAQPAFVLHGANDGWVPFGSAHWGQFRATVRADHAQEIGYDLSPAGALPFGFVSHTFDHLALYMRIAGEIVLLGEH